MSSSQSVNANTKKGADRHLIFALGSEEYSVPLLKVKEVIEVPDITPVPHTPTYYLGIMNLRGQVISIIDLRLKLKNVKQELEKKTAVIILDFDGFCLGIAVSAVNRVLALTEDEINERPTMETTENLDYITGVAHRDKKLILLLDVSKALNVEDLNLIHTQKTQQAA
ncbi:MAG TPA: chemotaxis protein CheW [Oligoflexus sp.]|uniref:chemotaxis protein CheW n=1 Tax=Oligoflexus sp. TaxID=1971216 RepID=UPI002D2FD74D|nr:chemotaxis protein CheW [Oligoflexus sp.]HYX37665.1 chemotaxis protein CheW [Oligoflexus sp.]